MENAMTIATIMLIRTFCVLDKFFILSIYISPFDQEFSVISTSCETYSADFKYISTAYIILPCYPQPLTTARARLEQIQRIVKIYLFSYPQLVLWLCHIV